MVVLKPSTQSCNNIRDRSEYFSFKYFVFVCMQPICEGSNKIAWRLDNLLRMRSTPELPRRKKPNERMNKRIQLHLKVHNCYLSPDSFEPTFAVLGAVRLTRAKQSPIALCILQSNFKKHVKIFIFVKLDQDWWDERDET